MKSEIRKCTKCERYTLDTKCPICSSDTVCSVPVRYSPDDRYGEYRRTSIREEYGENGKYNKI